MSSQGKKGGTKLSDAFLCLFSNVFYIFVVELIGECARNEVTIEFEADLNNWIIDYSLTLERIIKVWDNFTCEFYDLVQVMEFCDLVNFISEDLHFVLEIYF